VQSAERNVITPLQGIVDVTHYYHLKYIRSTHCLEVSSSSRFNRFYVFGGKDESSYQLIQGITLSGVFFDEVALMPRSFVEQAITRTVSVDEAKLWFNCNPDSSEHWFYKEWILQTDNRKALHLHFTMSDNPTLSKSQIEYAESQFSGVFYDRYIKGLWVLAEGLVYPMFKKEYILDSYSPSPDALFYISCDYGILNPTSMGLWALEPDKAVRLKEYYYDGRKNQPRTDEEHYQALENLAKGYSVQFVIVDPSASSFIECIKRHKKFRVRKANNNVIDGISNVSTLMSNDKIFICESCKGILKELSLYRWEDKSTSEKDRVIKEHDHACDDMRYFVNTVAGNRLLRGLIKKGGSAND
jgi:PBSX family phage terminase large subunit